MMNAVYWIEGPWSGRLAILSRPRGGEWLEDEIASLKHMGFQVIVSLLTSRENAELDLEDEAKLAAQHELQFLSFPIDDRSTPRSFRETQTLVEQLMTLLVEGKQVGIHCRQGVGRSALLAASILVHTGVDVDEAFARIEAARGCSVPDTEEQRQWVERFAALEALTTLYMET